MNDRSRGAHDSLAEQAVSVHEDLYHFLPSQSHMVSWVAGVAKKVLCAEVVKSMQPQHGFQFNASNSTSKYLEGSFVQEAAGKMQNQDCSAGVQTKPKRCTTVSSARHWGAVSMN